MAIVSGIVRDSERNALAGIVVTITADKPIVGFDDGAVARQTEIYTTNGSGVLTTGNLAPGLYHVTMSVPVNNSTTQTVLLRTTGVATEAAEMTLEEFLADNALPVNSTILQQALAAAAAADASADRAEVLVTAVVARAYFPTLAALTADNNAVIGLTGSGADFIVTTGDLIEIADGGFVYRVVTTGENLTTAGGVKLRYVSGGYVNDPGIKMRQQDAVARNKMETTAYTITGATAANPVVITTSAPHGYANGDTVQLLSLGGMVQVNSNFYTVANVTSTTFALQNISGVNINGSAFTAYTSGGTVRRVEGWALLDDSGHAPNGVASVVPTGAPQRALQFNFGFTTPKIGSFLATTDETLAGLGVQMGASVQLDRALVSLYQDMIGYVDHSNMQAFTPSFLNNRPTVINNNTGTVSVYHNPTVKMEPPQVWAGATGGTSGPLGGYNPRIDFIPKIVGFDTSSGSSSSFTYGCFRQLSGEVSWNGSAWVVTTNSFSKPIVTAFSSYLDLNWNNADIVLTGAQVSAISGVTGAGPALHLYHVWQPQSATRLRVQITDFAGNVQNGSPATTMRFQFFAPVWVLQDVYSVGITCFSVRGAFLYPEHFVSESGNIWIKGAQFV